jgi:hypothetical protein
VRCRLNRSGKVNGAESEEGNMRLGKEQATGVIQESAGVGSVGVDEPGEREAEVSVAERAGASRVSTLSEQGDLVRSR